MGSGGTTGAQRLSLPNGADAPLRPKSRTFEFDAGGLPIGALDVALTVTIK